MSLGYISISTISVFVVTLQAFSWGLAQTSTTKETSIASQQQTPVPRSVGESQHADQKNDEPGLIRENLKETASSDNTQNQVQSVTAIAEMVMKSHEQTLRTIETYWLIGSIVVGAIVGLGALLVGVAGFFGFSRFREFTRRMDDNWTRLQSHEAEGKQIVEALRLSFSALKASILAYEKCKVALGSFVESEKPGLNEEEKRGIKMEGLKAAIKARDVLEKVLKHQDLIAEKGDPGVIGWALQVYGTVIGTINKLSEKNDPEVYRKALATVERGTELWPDSSSGWYNAACFACMLGEQEKATRYIQRAISLDPSHGAEVAADPDFENCRGEAEFQIVIRQG